MVGQQGWTWLHRHRRLSGELNGLLDYFNLGWTFQERIILE